MNKRDQQIADINARTEGLHKDRLTSFRAQILESYVTSSIVDTLASVHEIVEREPSDFRVLTNSEARHVDNFNDDSFWWDMYCRELGRSIALAEKGHIFEALAELPDANYSIVADEPDFACLVEAYLNLRSTNRHPNALAAPISMFMKFNQAAEIKIDWSARQEALEIGNERVPIFWSSNSIALNRFVLFDSSGATWTVKLDPHTGDRLTIAIGIPSSPAGAVTFLAETVVKYEIEDPNSFCAIPVLGDSNNEGE
jgi:hypothetical protein